jgi:hypothetical protein
MHMSGESLLVVLVVGLIAGGLAATSFGLRRGRLIRPPFMWGLRLKVRQW